MPEEIKKGQEVVPPVQEANEDLDTFANRKIAELTARVTTLKEYFQSKKSEVPDGENFDQEIAQIEQILEDFEVSVREILQIEEEHLPVEQKKGVIETLAADSGSQIQNLEPHIATNIQGEAVPERAEVAPTEDLRNPEQVEIKKASYYKKEAFASAKTAMSEVADKKIAQLIRVKLDDFGAFCDETNGKSEISVEGKAELMEREYQQFLDKIAYIMEHGQETEIPVAEQEDKVAEVSIQEAEPVERKSVSLDDLEVVAPVADGKTDRPADAAPEKKQGSVKPDFKAELNKAEGYSAKLSDRISNIIDSIRDNTLRIKLGKKFRKIYNEFEAFCEDIALNDMEEFDYDGKVEIMESRYQKTLTEIERLASQYLPARSQEVVKEPKVGVGEVTIQIETPHSKPVTVSLDDLEVVAPVADGKTDRPAESVSEGKQENEKDFEKGAKEKLVVAEAKVDAFKLRIKDNEHSDEITKELDEFLGALKNDKDRVANYPDISFEQREGWFDGLIEQFNNRLQIIETNIADRETTGLEEAAENRKSEFKVIVDSLKLQLESKENKNEVSAELDRILGVFSQNADKMIKRFGLSPAEKALALTDLSIDTRRELQTLAEKEALSLPEEDEKKVREKLEAFVNEKIALFEPRVDALYDRINSQEDAEERTAHLDNISNILEVRIGQIIEDDSLSFDQKTKEIEINFQEFEEKLKLIEADLPQAGESEETDKGKKKKNKLKEGLGKFGKGFKEAMKTKEGRIVLTKTAYDTVATILGVKFATDLVLATTGRGDIANYVKQKREVGGEKKNIRESLVKGEKEKVREIIEASTNISPEEKKVLFDRLEALDTEYKGKDKKLQKEKQARVNETLNVYIQNKVKGAKIARDFLNSALTAVGLSAFRGGAYLLGSMAERTQKAATAHDKERLSLEDTEKSEENPKQEAKMHFVLRDLLVNSTVETVRSLAGKGKTIESKHKTIDRIQALGTLARAAGLGWASVNAENFSGSIDELLSSLEKADLGEAAHKGFGSVVLENFVQNADRIIPGSFSSDGHGQAELATEIGKLVQTGASPEQVDSPAYLAIINLFKASPHSFGIDGMSDEQIAHLGNGEIMALIREKGDIKALTDTLRIGDFSAGQPDSTEALNKALEDTTRTELIRKVMFDPQKYGYQGPMTPEAVSDWTVQETSGKSTEALLELVKGPAVAHGAEAASGVVPSAPIHFEDTIDSSQFKGSSDSIWRSTHDLFEAHAKELGYKGDPNDQEALSKWAETQTANAVHQLGVEQGGNVKDLVHDGDKINIEIVDGKPHLSFEASSGIEAGHLEAANVEKFVADHEFGDNIDHHLAVDESTGDQYIEIKSGEDVYKVYDWDRDGEPDLVFPDGHHQEMSSEELTKFFEEKNIIAPSEADLQELSNNANEAVEAAKQATLDKLDAFVNKGEGTYSQEMFAVAKEKGQVDQIFRHILASNDRRQASSFVSDYFRDQGLTDNKKDIFLAELNHILGTEDGRNYAGTTSDMLRSFDENVITNFKALDQHFSENGDSDWTAVHVGDTYALVQKHGGGLFGKARFLIDTNGDGEPDSIKPNIKAMQEAFEGKRPIGYEGKIPEQVAPAPDEKTFSLSRPEAPTTETGEQPQAVNPEGVVPDKATEVAPAPVANPESPANIENVEVPMSPSLSLAIESLNRGDASLAFDLSKLETADLDYLNKVKTNCEAMVVVLRDSKEVGAVQLRDGYKEVLDLINNQLEKAGSMDKAA